MILNLIRGDLGEAELTAVSGLYKSVRDIKSSMEFDLMKYKLAGDSLGVALWDIGIENSDLFNPKNKAAWTAGTA